MNNPPGHVDQATLDPLIQSYRAGNVSAGDELCRLLQPAVQLDTRRMLGDGHADVDDVTQEALIGCLGYLRAESGFRGDAVRLVVTIARNRCRDLLRWQKRHAQEGVESLENWWSDESHSALDELAGRQLDEYLQQALDRLGESCRDLLRALYVDGETPEAIRIKAGLSTVQGIYYRRGVCVEQLRNLLQRRLRFGSGTKVASVVGGARKKGKPVS